MNFDKEKHLLNNEDMDIHHKDFVDIYNSLKDDTQESYKIVMTKILEQTKVHFCHEEDMMKKHAYPRIREHSDEHKKVLYEMEYFIKNSNSMIGEKLLKSYYKEGLPNWFDSHLLSMDSDLASFLKDKVKP
jgi:hemerythrin-like metal-binding protein